MSVVLACDLGGTNFRAALIDAAGQTLAEAHVPSPPGSAGAGWAEIDPDEWWSTLIAAVTALAAHDGGLLAQVQAMAICGVTRTQVFLDAEGRSLRPAMTWRDARAEELLAELLPTLPASHPEAAQVNAFHPLARLAWLHRHEPQYAAQLHVVLEPKDYLNFRLTGAQATDAISSARLLASARTDEDSEVHLASVAQSEPGAEAAGSSRHPSLLHAAGITANVVPQVLAPTQCVGRVMAGLPGLLAKLAGVPVYACSNDTWAAVAGLGALRTGYAYNISGTTEVLGVMGSEEAQAPGLMTVQWGEALYQVGGPGQNGADTLAWLLSLLREPLSLAAHAESAQVHSNVQHLTGQTGLSFDALLAGARDTQPLLFLPYLQGERVPYWDANLRGAFVGLNRRHGATDLAWAVIEGVAFLNRVVLERGERATGSTVREIRYGGGAAANPLWCQVKADICERPVVTGQAAQPGLLGAAIVAWTGVGQYPFLSLAQAQMAKPGLRYEPSADRRDAYRQLAALYAQATEALLPISHGLAAMDGQIAR